jgi:hypothetical protein
MASSGSKKTPAKPAPKKAVPAPATKKPMPMPGTEKTLPLRGKKVVGGKANIQANIQPPTPVTDAITTAVPAAPAPEVSADEKPLCWIELVKDGSVFVARSNTYGGPSKEYKNRVLEDMLTELILELQEEIQE